MVQGFIVDFNLARRMVSSWVEATEEVPLDRDEIAYRTDRSCGHLPLLGLRHSLSRTRRWNSLPSKAAEPNAAAEAALLSVSASFR